MDRLPNAASVALIDKRKVLLIQRARAPYSGMWTLPGGRLEPGETPKQCAAREIKEELGLRVHRLQPVTQLSLGEAGNFLLQVFATEAFEGEIVPSEEIAAYHWVRPEMTGRLVMTPQLGEVLERALRLFERS
ncbi:MAG: NUDIX hydrolase [Devosia sp.]